MRNHLQLATAALVLLLAGGLTLAQAGKTQAVCPVSGKSIDKNVFVDHQGQRVYFCCQGCPAAFRAEKEKFYAQFEKDGVQLVNIQTTCPVSGERLDSHGGPVTLSHKGRTIKLCCPACERPFVKDPEKYLAKLPGEKF